MHDALIAGMDKPVYKKYIPTKRELQKLILQANNAARIWKTKVAKERFNNLLEIYKEMYG